MVPASVYSNRRMREFFGTVVVGWASLCLTLPASATEPEPEPEPLVRARTLFSEGVRLLLAGDPAAALQRFIDADRLHHAPNITYNIARARESLGQAQAAIDAYEAYLGEADRDAELASAATVAIAQIKARSTRLLIRSRPAGARVHVDGIALGDPTPVSVYVLRGRHHIALSLDTWKDQRSYDAKGGGDRDEIELARPEAPRPPSASVARPKQRATPRKHRKPAPEQERDTLRLSGLMGGAALTLSVYRFVGTAEESNNSGTTTADSAPSGLVFGLNIDAGYALSEKTALLVRGFGGLGSSEDDLASLLAGGPVAAFRLSSSWWFGMGLILGSSVADSDATTRPIGGLSRDAQVTYRTDFALGPTLELSYAIAETRDGQLLLSIFPSMLVTTQEKQSTLFAPLVLGFRWL